MTRTDFRQAALGDDPQVFMKAFAEVNERIAQSPEVAVDDYGTVLRSLEYTSQHCETVTPLAIETYGKFVEAFERTRGMDRNLSPTQALEHLLAYSRHHYYEREAVVEAALESLPRLAAATRHWAYVQDIFTDRANAALVTMRGTNPSSAELVQRAVEFLQPRLHMSGLNNDLI
jgi:phytoene dehydrogenase-like protein